MKTRVFFEAAGAAILLLAPRFIFVLSPYHLDLYHSMLPFNTLSGGILLDLLVCTAIFLAVFYFVQKRDNELRGLVWLVFSLLFLQCGVNAIPTPEDKVGGITGFFFPYLVGLKGHLVILQIALGVLGFSLWWRRREIYSRCMRGVQGFLLLLGVCWIWIVPQLTYQAFYRQNPDVAKYARAVTSEQANAHQRRIVWIIFDELSFEKLFTSRPASIDPVNFDHLREQSYFFTNIQPDGKRTDRILPGLFMGQHVEDIRSNLDGQLLFRSSDEDRWQSFDEKSTLFAEAHELGWTTGLVGYFNPYCRILPSVLDSCFWINEENPRGHLSPRLTTWRNAIRPLESAFFRARFKHEPGVYGLHLNVYQEGERESEQLLDDENLRFLILHLGIPHPPGIYDRQRKTLGHGSYLDNLQLTDVVLKTFLDRIERSPSADRTTVIVSSDHSWRVWMWQGDPPNWSEEDTHEASSGVDHRPVLMIHLPGQKNRHDIGHSVPEMKEHDIVEAMLRKEDFSSGDLEQILQR